MKRKLYAKIDGNTFLGMSCEWGRGKRRDNGQGLSEKEEVEVVETDKLDFFVFAMGVFARANP
jgi:hypothetical protein